MAAVAYSRADRHHVAPTGAAAMCCCGHNNGNIVTLYSCGPTAKRFPAVCMVGPDWPCLICSFALILVPSVIFLVYISQEQHPFVLAGGVVTLLSNVIALAVTAFSNPGVIEKQSPAVMNAQAAELGARLDDVTPCAECNVYRNAYGYHCADCNSCVSQLDHHCPWTGKCIGEYNLRAFYAFLWTLLVNIVYVAICSFVYLLGGKKDE